jgi:hypothetical protein
LTSLNLANNSLGDIVILEGWTEQVNSERTGYEYKHLDGTVQGGKPGKPEGVIAIANAIPDMRAISTFMFSGDGRDSEPITMETSMVEADFGGKYLGTSGAIMVAAFLPKCT